MNYTKLLSLLLGMAIGAGCTTEKKKEIKFRGICIDDPAGMAALYNSERGFRLEVAVDVANNTYVWEPEQYQGATSYLQAQAMRYSSDSVSLVQTYFYLHGFVGKKISEEAFGVMECYLDTLRAMGKKAVLRFAYETDFMGRASSGPTLEDVLLHMEQLKPFLQKNTDVIQVMQAGFIGAWGEWHSSLHGLENSQDTKRTILQKILWMTPPSRSVQIRVPEYKNLLAKDSREYQRTSFHDDFIITKPHRWDGGMHEGTPFFRQIVEESPYLPVDGELPWGTWSVNQDKDNPQAGWIIDGLAVARQLFLQHFTSLSAIHNYKENGDTSVYSMKYWKETPVTKAYLQENKMPVSANYFEKKDGTHVNRNVFDYIRDHLGYRIELQQLTVDGKLLPGKPVHLTLTLKNRGFSTLFNEHPVYYTLMDPTGAVCEFLTAANVHEWQPYEPGDTTCRPLQHIVELSIVLPETFEKGKYKIGLWIPDGSDRLKYDSRFAIRCANGNTEWYVSPDGRYGLNILTTI